MSEDAHWSGIDVMALRDLKVCQTCGDIYDGTKCGSCPRLRAEARSEAEQLLEAGVSDFGFVQRETDAPALMAYRVFLIEELAALWRLRRQSAAIDELRHTQRAAALYAKLPRVEPAAPPMYAPSRVVWALIGCGVLAILVFALWGVR